jgi:hypothetical protein
MLQTLFGTSENWGGPPRLERVAHDVRRDSRYVIFFSRNRRRTMHRYIKKEKTVGTL